MSEWWQKQPSQTERLIYCPNHQELPALRMAAGLEAGPDFSCDVRSEAPNAVRLEQGQWRRLTKCSQDRSPRSTIASWFRSFSNLMRATLPGAGGEGQAFECPGDGRGNRCP